MKCSSTVLTSVSDLDDILVVAHAALRDDAHLRGGRVAGQVRRIAGRGAGVAPLDGRKVGDPKPELVLLLLQEGGFHGLAQLGGAGAGVRSAR